MELHVSARPCPAENQYLNNSMKKITTLALLALSVAAFAQDKAPANWFNLSNKENKVHGVGTEKVYSTLTTGRTTKTVVVAVLDGGVDYEHEDLKDVMWKNPGEIPGNKIDDDKNGYVDDVYGWNFLGNSKGENIRYEQLELVRQLAPLQKKYKGKMLIDVPAADRDEYLRYEKMQKDYDEDLKSTQKGKAGIDTLAGLFIEIKNAEKKNNLPDTLSYASFKDHKPSPAYDKMHSRLKLFIRGDEILYMLKTQILTAKEQLDAHLNYHLNLEYDARKIAGDNPDDINDRNYGNNDVKGPDALHGTHVAGIIAAVRNNNIGMNGVASDVRIMALRCVPDGDERDKDVALSIRYAVDNGAQIINMSFGKDYSKNKGIVDEAVKYAESKGVLLVHAAGNDGKDITSNPNYPSPLFASGERASNWIEVGALSWKTGKKSLASFSNYSKTKVDVFAPGVDIYSTKSNGGYINESGTSMASPVCAGVCTLLKMYFPELTPQQIKTIIEKSADRSMAKKKVIIPGTKKKKTKFRNLCVTGGMVDAYAAFLEAKAVTGK